MLNEMIEQEVVIEIKEVITKKESITTQLILEVEYCIDEYKIARKCDSRRYILCSCVVNGESTSTKYAADGWVTMDEVMDIHNSNFERFFNSEKKTKISIIDKLS